ncbi:hypothetical protein M2352_005280 [Azospirillum fermentarium]|uniref:hypothetical protein n=1 Tax=Azospirillum fermentarium TaxID=1233114 RepID=UPI0022262AF4|nr:hypothetical protein [Azospirillum fermentarium]MCW2249597.1 hypothetical protein [Azospirillum fermentarium]
MKKSVYAVAAAAVLITALPAVAQQQGQRPQGQAAQNTANLNALPPALRAAVIAGNPEAIARAITTLSGNDATQAASLAAQVVRVAEQQIFNTDPKAAIAIAQAAVTTVKETPVQQNAPQQTQEVITTAARLFIRPEALRVAPDATAQLAASAVQAAATTNNAALAASTASQAVSTAERILTINPAAAVQIASVAMQSVRQEAVSSNAPQEALQTATTAARIVLAPSVQAAAPQQVAVIAAAAVQVVSNPLVYQSAPTAAINVMAQSYAAVSTQTVSSVAPNVVAAVTGQLMQAARTNTLNQVNPTNGSQINDILEKKSPEFKQAAATADTPQQAPQQNVVQQPAILPTNELDRNRTTSPS